MTATDTNIACRLDPLPLLEELARADDWLLVQDLDGVCMGLVEDPLTRRLERRYVEAAARLRGRFLVLTNGEHSGRRGVNTLVEAALGGGSRPRREGLYLPGLGAGGVQWQDRFGRVEHPGVDAAELAFLARVPARASRFLGTQLAASPWRLDDAAIAAHLRTAVLDNALSPTLNLNGLFAASDGDTVRFGALQRAAQVFMHELLAEAAEAGLDGSFFVHLAPNLGRDANGREQLLPAGAGRAGSTDFQLMLSGALKQAGLLALLNHHVHARHGHWPLGATFNARRAPRGHEALLALARDRLDPAQCPMLVGVGDTVSSQADAAGEYRRGGSDRGFLQLLQALGRPGRVVFVDSSGGELTRPKVDRDQLARAGATTVVDPWPALVGITDPLDPLRLDYVLADGHRQYLDFFCALAATQAD